MAMDAFHLPFRSRSDVQIFNALNTTAWQVWQRPRGCTMLYAIMASGGGGGGGGHCRASGAAGGGGGSGACSGLSMVMLPIAVFPDTLYVQVGKGGTGGANSAVTGTSGGAGGNGTNSYISLGHSTALPSVILSSGTNAPGGGGGGTAAAAGTAGTIPTVATVATLGTTYKYGLNAHTTDGNASYVGLVGVAGGAVTGANGTAITAGWNVIPFTPGSGGGGIATTTDFTGGAISLQAAMELPDMSLPSAIITAAAAATNGSNGIQIMKPLLGTGGGGGGTSNAGNAGHGGSGAIGCGGGGGGSGLVSGRGGNGGDGIIIMVAW